MKLFLSLIFVTLPAMASAQQNLRVAVSVTLDCNEDGIADATAGALFEHESIATNCSITFDSLLQNRQCGPAEIPASVVSDLVREITEEAGSRCSDYCSGQSAENLTSCALRQCPAAPLPDIRATIQVPSSPSINNELNNEELEQLQDEHNKQSPYRVPGKTVVGLHHLNQPPRIDNANIGAVPGVLRLTDPGDPLSAGCIAVTELRMPVVIPEVTVYVSSDYPAGSCQFDVIRQHEMEHFERLQDFARNRVDPYEQRLRESFSAPRRFCCGEDIAEDRLQAEIVAEFQRLVIDMSREIYDYTDEIDTTPVMEEIGRRLEACGP